MFIIDWIVKLASNTLGKWSFPWVEKKFNLNHYYEIEKKFSELPVPFAIGVATTYGHGSNILIKFANLLSKDKRKRKSNKTHAFAIISCDNGSFKTIEAMGPGIQEVSFLSSIGNRDEVKIRFPKYNLMNEKVCEHALNYIKEVAKRDACKNIPYDLSHDLLNPERYDCSELVFHSINHGFKMADQASPLKPVKRGGQDSWAPVEAEFCELFEDIYDSKKGFL